MTVTFLWLLFGLFGISKTFTAEIVLPIQSTFKIVHSIRVYQRLGRSQQQWREITPPDLRCTTSTEVKERCVANPVMPSPESKTRAEQMVGQHGKLLTWSHDGTMFVFVDRNPSIQPPKPYPWGCDDCFFPDLKVARTSDARVLATIRLPEFGEHWNYPDSSTWSPDGQTLLVGAQAGSSDSHRSEERRVGKECRSRWSPYH